MFISLICLKRKKKRERKKPDGTDILKQILIHLNFLLTNMFFKNVEIQSVMFS